MERLANARVIVFGLGGVGSYAVEGLVRSGVGHLTLVDFDDVCVTNTNRQLHATVSDRGQVQGRADGAALQADQPRRRRHGGEGVLPGGARRGSCCPPGAYDFVVDAIDNVKAKLHLLHRCVTLGVPVVSSMGAAGRLDPTAIRVEDLCETHMDPFAKDIRKLLKRKYGVDTDRPTGITAVYSIEPRREPVPLTLRRRARRASSASARRRRTSSTPAITARRSTARWRSSRQRVRDERGGRGGPAHCRRTLI